MLLEQQQACFNTLNGRCLNDLPGWCLQGMPTTLRVRGELPHTAARPSKQASTWHAQRAQHTIEPAVAGMCPAGADGEEQLLYMNVNRDEVATNIISYEPAPDGSIQTPSECWQQLLWRPLLLLELLLRRAAGLFACQLFCRPSSVPAAARPGPACRTVEV